MSKHILMLTSTWDSNYTKAIIAGILDRIGDDDIELHICNSNDAGMETDYFRKGREIYQLPVYERYDGLILALSSLGSSKFVNEISERFHSYNKPVVGIDTHADNAIFCGLDNYRSMYQLVEHMVTIHDCRIFNYLGGPEDNDENRERYRAFCDCLASHGINVSKKRVLNKRFWKTDGRNAYNEWKEMGVNMADAIICANDYMALGYVEEASKDGITVPDYIKVTGFDNLEEAQQYSPSITSVNRNWKLLGFESMDALMEAMDGNTEFDTRFVEGYVNYNESCGCDLTRDIRGDYNIILEKTKKELDVALRNSYARQLLFKCRTIGDYSKALKECTGMLNIGDVAICLNSSFFESDPDTSVTGYDEKMTLYCSEGELEADRHTRLYPPEWREDHKTFLFSPLRNSIQTFGYIVMPYRSDFFERLKHRTFIETLSLSLDNLNKKLAIDKFIPEKNNG